MNKKFNCPGCEFEGTDYQHSMHKKKSNCHALLKDIFWCVFVVVIFPLVVFVGVISAIKKINIYKIKPFQIGSWK